jgi:hypothetical protein
MLPKKPAIAPCGWIADLMASDERASNEDANGPARASPNYVRDFGWRYTCTTTGDPYFNLRAPALYLRFKDRLHRPPSPLTSAIRFLNKATQP